MRRAEIPGLYDYRPLVKLEKGRAFNSGMAVAFDFAIPRAQGRGNCIKNSWENNIKKLADALFKIYRATGDLRYAGLLKDVIHAWSEGVQPNGGITERLGYRDAGSRGSRIPGGKTGWNETNGALMALEIPGIYLRTDAEKFFVFDQVNARVVSRTDDGVIIEIHNITLVPAEITIFAENYEESCVAMPVSALITWPKVTLTPGEINSFLVVKDDNRIINVE